MSDSVSVRHAIYSRLNGTTWSMSPAPEVVWANTANAGTRPRIEVAPAAQSNAPLHFDSRAQDNWHNAEIVLTVVVDVGTGEAESGPIVSDIVDRFPSGAEVGDAEIARLPEERPGFTDGREYRVPVVLPYRAIVS